ncbi:hypothetical protein EVG20_g9154 [Dentipellis fragilis]|uniref:Uncharacterized protein n=1 Tax=Dentipellis fragilis TaxID=205917 RepID=A0A4Y9Y1D1_9AGAM|nr:hypothetical protein EVG20_g9154 [Dentipellis fragilis]
MLAHHATFSSPADCSPTHARALNHTHVPSCTFTPSDPWPLRLALSHSMLSSLLACTLVRAHVAVHIHTRCCMLVLVLPRPGCSDIMFFFIIVSILLSLVTVVYCMAGIWCCGPVCLSCWMSW